MGFNTVMFALNDRMHEMSRSPQCLVELVTNPNYTQDTDEANWKIRHDLAQEYDEQAISPSSLVILPTFHADCKKFYMAGGNCIIPLKEVERKRKRSGKIHITLELPDWAS